MDYYDCLHVVTATFKYMLCRYAVVMKAHLQIVSACSSMALFRMRISCLRLEKEVLRHALCAIRALATAAATCTCALV